MALKHLFFMPMVCVRGQLCENSLVAFVLLPLAAGCYASCVVTPLFGNCCMCPGVSRAASYAKRVQTMSGGRPVIAPIRDDGHLGQVVPEVAAAVAATTE